MRKFLLQSNVVRLENAAYALGNEPVNELENDFKDSSAIHEE